MKICAFTSVCEADEKHVSRYLKEMARLELPFVMHFDRCSEEFRAAFWESAKGLHSATLLASTERNDDGIFAETDKQAPLDALVSLDRFDWAMAMDIDETWERAAAEKFARLPADADLVNVRWLNLWDHPDQIRVDTHYAHGHRTKFLNLRSGFEWRFSHAITNGATGIWRGDGPAREPVEVKVHDLVSLHWGMLTREDRLAHKERWDRIYGHHVGNNPYGFWQDACDESKPATVVKHGYF